jgi:hypothetical protein
VDLKQKPKQQTRKKPVVPRQKRKAGPNDPGSTKKVKTATGKPRSAPAPKAKTAKAQAKSKAAQPKNRARAQQPPMSPMELDSPQNAQPTEQQLSAASDRVDHTTIAYVIENFPGLQGQVTGIQQSGMPLRDQAQQVRNLLAAATKKS